MRSPQSGLSLLEFTLVVVTFAVLGAVFLNAITSVRVEIERASVRQTLNQMRSALAIRFSELYIRGDQEAIADWAGGNALALLREGTELRGAITGDDEGVSGPGEWAFEDGVIVYRPVFPEALTGRPAAVGRWKVVVEGTPEDPKGLRLRTIDPLLKDAAKANKGD